jgi:hypothetical protein
MGGNLREELGLVGIGLFVELLSEALDAYAIVCSWHGLRRGVRMTGGTLDVVRLCFVGGLLEHF